MAQNLYIDGTEMSAGDHAWPNQLVRQFELYINEAEPFKSTERILQSFFGFIRGLGQPDEAETEAEIHRCVFVIEFPNPYNQTFWIPEYGTHVNVCGETGERWIADRELRENPTEHFLDLVKKQEAKFKAWQDLRGPAEVYNEQAKAINTFILFCRTFQCAARIVLRDEKHMPDGDALRSVFHPYMLTKTHWYLPRPNEVLEPRLLNNNNMPTKQGHKNYGSIVGKQLTRENIVARK